MLHLRAFGKQKIEDQAEGLKLPHELISMVIIPFSNQLSQDDLN